MIGKAIHTICTTNSAWKALAGTRMYPLQLPQEPRYPAGIYQRISGPRVRAMGADPGLVLARVQVESWDVTYAGAVALAEATRQALQRFSGTAAGITIQDVFLDNEMDREDGEQRVHMVIQDFMIAYEE